MCVNHQSSQRIAHGGIPTNFNFSATFAEKTEPHNAAPHWYALYRFSREARY